MVSSILKFRQILKNPTRIQNLLGRYTVCNISPHAVPHQIVNTQNGDNFIVKRTFSSFSVRSCIVTSTLKMEENFDGQDGGPEEARSAQDDGNVKRSNNELDVEPDQKMKADQNDKPAPVLNSSAAAQDSSTQEKAKKKKHKSSNRKWKKNTTSDGSTERPNFFIAVEINDEQVRERLKSVQDSIVENEPRLKSIIVPVATAHLTLLVLYLQDENEVQRALETLKKTFDAHRSSFSEMEEKLEVAELGHFNNQVLYAKVRPGVAFTTLTKLAKDIRTSFESESFNLSGNEKFVAHLTIFKTSKDQSKTRLRKIPKESYVAYEKDEFGAQKVSSIQLCSMVHPKQESGYYHICGEYTFRSADDPVSA